MPGIFWHEVRNVLIVAERTKRIGAGATANHLERLRSLRFITDNDQDDRQTVALARALRIQRLRRRILGDGETAWRGTRDARQESRESRGRGKPCPFSRLIAMESVDARYIARLRPTPKIPRAVFRQGGIL